MDERAPLSSDTLSRSYSFLPFELILCSLHLICFILKTNPSTFKSESFASPKIRLLSMKKKQESTFFNLSLPSLSDSHSDAYPTLELDDFSVREVSDDKNEVNSCLSSPTKKKRYSQELAINPSRRSYLRGKGKGSLKGTPENYGDLPAETLPASIVITSSLLKSLVQLIDCHEKKVSVVSCYCLYLIAQYDKEGTAMQIQTTFVQLCQSLPSVCEEAQKLIFAILVTFVPIVKSSLLEELLISLFRPLNNVFQSFF